MKKLIIAFTVILSFTTITTLAAEVKVSTVIQNMFHKKFGYAGSVSWSKADGFVVAEFMDKAHRKFAYFNTDGELVLVAKPLRLEQLSDAQQDDLLQRYSNHAIKGVYQVEDNEDIKFFAVVENESSRIILRTSTSKWSVVKHTKK